MRVGLAPGGAPLEAACPCAASHLQHHQLVIARRLQRRREAGAAALGERHVGGLGLAPPRLAAGLHEGAVGAAQRRRGRRRGCGSRGAAGREGRGARRGAAGCMRERLRRRAGVLQPCRNPLRSAGLAPTLRSQRLTHGDHGGGGAGEALALTWRCGHRRCGRRCGLARPPLCSGAFAASVACKTTACRPAKPQRKRAGRACLKRASPRYVGSEIRSREAMETVGGSLASTKNLRREICCSAAGDTAQRAAAGLGA